MSPTTVTSFGVVEDMKQRAVDQPQTSLQTIYNDVMQRTVGDDPTHADELTASIPTYNSCRMSLHRARKKNEGVLPKQRADIQLTEELQTLPDGRTFLQGNEGDEDKILLFATDQSLARVSSKETVFVDGTFYTAPRLFCQLFTFHVEEQGKLFPMIFALLPDKAQQTYQRLFELVKTRAALLG